MAYNLQSLITILEQILKPEQTRWILGDHNKPQLQSLLQKALSLNQILQKSSHPKIEISLESQIREATHEAEDLIETFMVDQMQARPASVSFTFLTPDLQQVMQQLDSVTEKVLKLTEETPTSTCEEVDEDIDEAEDVVDSHTADHDQMLCGSMFKWLITCFTSSSRDPSSKRRAVVGVERDLVQLKDRLTRNQRKLEIVPIVGMGGIGKTFLAQNLYQDPKIVNHFHVRAWSTVSQDYNIKAFLSDLGCKTGKKFDQSTELENLRKRLYGRRYLIVLDDIWKVKFWDEVKFYFPDNNNGSRIVITTRESDMAKQVASQSIQHHVQLLSKSDSWDLLLRTVFGEDQENCPHFLRATGKKIAVDCGGLPLAINVIGGLLLKVERSKHAWEYIADDVKAAISQLDNKRFANILSLSYNHLSNHLKPCFLYMGAFPEDYEVKASKLARLWVAEGFVEARGDDKSLEEEAKEYLEALVERNLLLIKTETSNGKPKRYGIHDLLRELCIEKAEEEKFLHTRSWAFSNPRRVSIHATNGRDVSIESMRLARSFISIGEEIMSPYFVGSRMMRVLDVKRNKFERFPPEILQLFNLRYLGVSCSSTLPPGISRLWNLQTLIAKIGKGKVPLEIWELSQLRHLKLNKSILFEDEHTRGIVEKEMLQTVSTVVVNPSLIRIGFFRSIPNVGNMRIKCDTLPSDPVDLTHLLQLQTLKFESRIGSAGRRSLPSFTFPSSITKLTLIKCEMFASVLKALSALPNMEILKILNCVFKSEDDTDVSEKWEVEKGDEFSSLKFLHLRHSTLVRWTADENNFPRLCRLFLESCHELEEIPSGIGEIPTLELIELKGCDSAVKSAKQIQEEQVENGNYDLKISLL